MNKNEESWHPMHFLVASIVLASIFLLLLKPECALEGASRGLSLCCKVVIPSLFPFLVLSRLFLEGPFSSVVGILLLPYTRRLGISSKKATGALVCGLLGGFAAGASAVEQLYSSGELSNREAEQLLICCIGSSPAFVVGSVGTAMLGSPCIGWMLFACQLISSFICGLLFHSKASEIDSSLYTIRKEDKGIALAIEKSVTATSILCGYIILFSFFSELLAPASMQTLPRFLLTLPLEVTNACYAAAESSSARVLLCNLAFSVMGISVFLQVRTLVGEKISLRPLALSRIAHALFSFLILKLLLWVFPITIPTAASFEPTLFDFRMPCEVICVVFLLCVLSTCRQKQNSHLPSRLNGV